MSVTYKHMFSLTIKNGTVRYFCLQGSTAITEILNIFVGLDRKKRGNLDLIYLTWQKTRNSSHVSHYFSNSHYSKKDYKL